MTLMKAEKRGGQHAAGPSLVDLVLLLLDQLSGIPVAVPIVIVIENVEQVSDCWPVDGEIGIVVVDGRIGQVIAGGRGELAEMPVALDQFHKGRVFAVDVGDVTTPRER